MYIKKQTIEFIKKIGSGKTIEIFHLKNCKNKRKKKIRFGQIKWFEKCFISDLAIGSISTYFQVLNKVYFFVGYNRIPRGNN